MNPHAVRYDQLTYDQVLARQPAGDGHRRRSTCAATAKLPILVFNFKQEGNIERAIAGHPIGTLVSGSSRDRRPPTATADDPDGPTGH